MRGRRSRSSSPANSNARRWPASTHGIRTHDPRSSGFVPRATMSTSPQEGARQKKRLYGETDWRACSTESSEGTTQLRARARPSIGLEYRSLYAHKALDGILTNVGNM